MNNVLLLAPKFYNYWYIIEKGLSQRGLMVQTIVYPSSFFYKLLGVISVLQSFAIKKRESFFMKKFLKLNKEIETIIVIKSSFIPEICLEYLKHSHPNARFILYLWDDLGIDNKEFSHFKYFDKILSFSKNDCEKFGLIYRPMFYDNSISCKQTVKDIDLFYIASYKRNRFEFLKKIIGYCSRSNIRYMFILRCSPFLFMKSIQHYRFPSLFRFKGLDYSEMMKMMCRSRCALELQHPGQTGLTTRPIEAIPTHTKIITTNKNIVNYSLYNKNNILIVDENEPVIPISWINSPYIELNDNIKYFYSLSCFINDLLT